MNHTPITLSSATRSVLILLFSSIVSACATPVVPQQFDFGSAATTTVTGDLSKMRLLLAEIQVPISLESNTMHYRLQYENAQELRPYSQSRWSMPPAQLIKQRIKAQINRGGGAVLSTNDGVKNLPLLKLELEEFSQHFSSPTQSQVQLRWRASLISNNQLLAQKIFLAQAPCDSADAKGGASAMPRAADLAIAELIDWLQGQVKPSSNSQ